MADPDPQIKRGGGGRGGHLDPEIREGERSQNFSFGSSGLILV